MRKFRRQQKKKKKQDVKQNSLAGNILAVAMLTIALFFIFSLATDPLKPTGKFHNGTITGAYKPETDDRAAKPRVIVKLDDGTVARILTTRMGAWQTGKRITVEEMRSKRFRRQAFRFVKYIEPPIKYLNESEQNRITSH